MARTLSANAIAAVLAQQTDQVFLELLTISGPGFDTFRVANNTENVISNGETYLGFPFELRLPEDIDQRAPQAQLRISNVGRELIAAVRGLAGGATASLRVVLAASPDTLELGPFDFDLLLSQYDAQWITFTLGFEPVLPSAFPAGSFTPDLFPGLF
ncbi:MAG: DUF1833 family protein [Sinimarinibacterium flocculans]|uniref:DUF1833 family protein n=1 Tax=Sinimarinibacterium flocculans TaxID=985250 RepID=UPI003C3B2EA0